MKIFPILFLFTSLFSFGQYSLPEQEAKDSIFRLLNEEKDSLRSEALNRAMKLSKEIAHDSLLKASSIKYASYNIDNKNVEEISIANKNLLDLYKRSNDSVALAKYYQFKADQFRQQFKQDSAYYYFNTSKEVFMALQDSIEVGRRLLTMAYMQKDEKDYVGAEATAIQALEFLAPSNNILYKGDSYNILANALANLGDYEEARKYYQTARKIFQNSQDRKERIGWELYLINNIGYTYLLEKKYKKAEKIFEKELKMDSLEFKFPDHYIRLLGNYSDCLFYQGIPKPAFKNYYKMLELRKNRKDIYGQSTIHNGLGLFYQLEGNTNKAIFHAKKGYQLAKQVHNNDTRLLALETLIKLSPKVESRKYFEEYTSLNDSLNEKERFFKKQFANVRYQTEKIDKENRSLKIQSQRERAEKNKQKQQKIIIMLFLIAAILTLGFSFTASAYRRKRLLYEAQLQKAIAREEERQQIAKSLHDEVAGDLRMIHQKLSKTDLQGEAKSIEKIKDNVRNLSHQLSSVSFDELSFKDQLINLITDNFSKDFRIKTAGIDTVAWEEINNTIKRTLYISVRESMQNTIKYAEANEFIINFSTEKANTVILKDNGKGFKSTKGKIGIGLKNLKERVEEIQGTFEVNSNEQGTITNIIIPINGR